MLFDALLGCSDIFPLFRLLLSDLARSKFFQPMSYRNIPVGYSTLKIENRGRSSQHHNPGDLLFTHATRPDSNIWRRTWASFGAVSPAPPSTHSPRTLPPPSYPTGPPPVFGGKCAPCRPTRGACIFPTLPARPTPVFKWPVQRMSRWLPPSTWPRP